MAQSWSFLYAEEDWKTPESVSHGSVLLEMLDAVSIITSTHNATDALLPSLTTHRWSWVLAAGFLLTTFSFLSRYPLREFTKVSVAKCVSLASALATTLPYCLCPYLKHVWQSCFCLSFNNSVAAIHRAVEAGQGVSRILFSQQQATQINGSVLLSIWQFAYFSFTQRSPHQLISTRQAEESRSLGKCHF